MATSYAYMENVLQKINKEKVRLSDEAKRENIQVLNQILKDITTELKKDELFDAMYTENFYGGSYYDGLKVNAPNEYDIDLKFILPKLSRPKVVPSNKYEGHAALEISMEEIHRQAYLAKYKKIEKFLIGNRVNANKFKSWFESILQKALNKLRVAQIVRTTKSGPASTIHIDGGRCGFDVDLVPVFYFMSSITPWPHNYRENNVKDQGFLLVPKTPVGDSDQWRLSFQLQESKIISGKGPLKPALRLLKVLRDKEATLDPLKSYFIKTVFLWELLDEPNRFEKKCLADIFMHMLERLYACVKQRKIPFYWNERFNLLERSDIYMQNAENRLGNIIKSLKRDHNTDKLWEIFGVSNDNGENGAVGGDYVVVNKNGVPQNNAANGGGNPASTLGWLIAIGTLAASGMAVYRSRTRDC